MALHSNSNIAKLEQELVLAKGTTLALSYASDYFMYNHQVLCFLTCTTASLTDNKISM